MRYVEEKKHATGWPSGQMHLIVIDIYVRHKDSGLGMSDSHARLEQKKLLREMECHII